MSASLKGGGRPNGNLLSATDFDKFTLFGRAQGNFAIFTGTINIEPYPHEGDQC